MSGGETLKTGDAASHDAAPVGFVPQLDSRHLELTIVVPCLNEAETLAAVIARAQAFLRTHRIDGEVIVADNGSTDGSVGIAVGGGARLVPIPTRGYGAALRGGIQAARGRYVAMGDADCSYDFMELLPFLERLRAGADLVVGNRFKGGIGKDAMPPLHRYLGNPLLSLVGRLFFRAPIGDFHCGLRAFDRRAILDLGLSSDGMEFASEMIVKSQLSRLTVQEVPATLVKDGRSRPPHLRSWRDGWRHLKFLLLFSPRWLFMVPGATLLAGGLTGCLALGGGDRLVMGVRFGIGTLLFSAAMVLIAAQLLTFALIASHFGSRERYWPESAAVRRLRRLLSVDTACLGGGGMVVAGLAVATAALSDWATAGFGDMDPQALMRVCIPAVLLGALGVQLILSSFLLELLSHPSRYRLDGDRS